MRVNPTAGVLILFALQLVFLHYEHKSFGDYSRERAELARYSLVREGIPGGQASAVVGAIGSSERRVAFQVQTVGQIISFTIISMILLGVWEKTQRGNSSESESPGRSSEPAAG